MIGIDVARIKRWYEKTYPTYAGTDYITVVDQAQQYNYDETPFMQGEDIRFNVGAWDVESKTCVHKVAGTYSRTHYGGWDAHFTQQLVPAPEAILVEDNSSEDNNGSGVNTDTETPVDNSSEGGES